MARTTSTPARRATSSRRPAWRARMVTEYGMSEKLGPLRYSRQRGGSVPRPLGDAQRKNISDATAKMIDEEVRRIVEEGEAKAREILTAHLDELHMLAKGLLEYETLNARRGEGPARRQADPAGRRSFRSAEAALLDPDHRRHSRPARAASSPSPPAADRPPENQPRRKRRGFSFDAPNSDRPCCRMAGGSACRWLDDG